MKKIFLIISMIFSLISNASIIVKDIPDYTFTANSSLNFDFNSDGITEFTFTQAGGSIQSFFNASDINFVTAAVFGSPNGGWDIIKSLPLGTNISPTSVFGALADAYINADWADVNQLFPAGDSYVGTKFKIGASTHYGWILVNSTGGANATIKIKSYAYNDIANASINTGQTLAAETFSKDFDWVVYPTITSEYLYFDTTEIISNVSVLDTRGVSILLPVIDNSINVSSLNTGIYFLFITTESNKSNYGKFIKK